MQRLFTNKNDHAKHDFSSEMKKGIKNVEISGDEGKSVRYVSYKEIFPGQVRYSSHNMNEKIAKLKKKEKAIWNQDEKSWEYKHHHGTSIFSKKDALPVINTKFGFVLVDGHHDLLSSIELKAEMIPIKIKEDLSHLSEDEFWKVAEEKGYVYLHKISGEKSAPPKSFSEHELIDDSNRYFAAITARKYFTNKDGTYDSKGAEYPLWIKIDKDIPYIEFKISNALFAKGFVYKIDQMGNPPKQECIEQARKILLEANIPGLRIVSTTTHFEKIKIDSKLQTFSIQASEELKENNRCKI